MRNESRKMLHLPELPVSCTCVRVPVFNGHSVSIKLELNAELSPNKAREILRTAPGVLLVDDPAERDFPTSVDASGQDSTRVGRNRRDDSVEHGLNLFCS